MLSESAFADLVIRIRNALGCSKELAADYARSIGDTPERANGKILVRNEDGRIIAYVPESALN